MKGTFVVWDQLHSIVLGKGCRGLSQSLEGNGAAAAGQIDTRLLAAQSLELKMKKKVL
jgi:hypothetical protein